MWGKEGDEGGEDMNPVVGALAQLVIGLVVGVVMFLIIEPMI